MFKIESLAAEFKRGVNWHPILLSVYPALTTIHHSNDENIQNFFVKNYNDLIHRNGQKIRVVPHQDPGVAQFSPAIAEVVQNWVTAALTIYHPAARHDAK